MCRRGNRKIPYVKLLSFLVAYITLLMLSLFFITVYANTVDYNNVMLKL